MIETGFPRYAATLGADSLEKPSQPNGDVLGSFHQQHVATALEDIELGFGDLVG